MNVDALSLRMAHATLESSAVSTMTLKATFVVHLATEAWVPFVLKITIVTRTAVIMGWFLPNFQGSARATNLTTLAAKETSFAPAGVNCRVSSDRLLVVYHCFDVVFIVQN